MNKKIMMLAFAGMMLHCGTSFGMFTILDWLLEEKTLVKEVFQDGVGESDNSNIDKSDEQTSPPPCKKEVILKDGKTMAIKNLSGRCFNYNIINHILWMW